jgi:glyoxylase-like metal-dependent hydrolase (beta-lactamase superfamily II)
MGLEPTGAPAPEAVRSAAVRRWKWGAIEVTRVEDPGFELVLPQDDATAGTLQQRPWLRPEYLTPEHALRIGSSATVVRTPSAVVLVDPWLAFDDPARLAPRLAALRSSGVDPADVDLVLNSHVDGIGANVEADGSPAFPNARYLLPQAELDALRAGTHGEQVAGIHPEGHPLLRLDQRGLFDGLQGGEHLLPGLLVEDAPGHSRGHVVLWITSGGDTAVVVGHLFLHPAQIANPTVETGDLDPVALVATRRALLGRCVEEEALLLGPLFADPGGGRVEPDGPDGWRLGTAD